MMVDPGRGGVLDVDTRQVFETSIITALNAFQEWTLAVVAEATAAQAGRRRDRLMKADEVADRLAMKVSWVYRLKLPFRVRLGTVPRFWEKGLEHYIRKRLGT
jgi:predicted DNA-binding transcriptional regulator AlpA